MWVVSPGKAERGTSGPAPFLAFRDISAQTYFIAITDRGHPSVNFFGLPYPMLPQTQCGRVRPGRKWRPWREERKEPQAGSRGVQVGDIRLDGERDGV